jgi:starch phosphorylase
VLAGDHLKAASDLGVPLIGVGLLYGSGYFRQSLSLDGWQLEHYPVLDPQGLPLHLLVDAAGAPLLVGVNVPRGRVLRARIWRADIGRVPLLLLDSDIEDNPDDLRGATDRLYGGDQDHRITQEILAGIGGVRAVRMFCELTGHPEPEVFHTNEGHAGFLGLERIRELIADDGLSFDEALTAVRAGTVFTTHTPVPAGIDRFPVDLVRHHFAGASNDAALLPGVDVNRMLALGAEDHVGMFNMAHMGLRLAQRSNGVSQLHGAVSRAMFRGLWPQFDVEEVPIGSVTNGVHGPTWAARELAGVLGESDDGSAALSAPDCVLWELRCMLRAKLVQEVRRRVRAAWLERGASAPELGWTSRIFDPQVLTMGFARRVPTYKRLTLMLRDPERLRALLLDPQRPVQLIIAGKSHPADDGGKALIQQVVRFADSPDVRHRIAFLPDYDMSMARYLYWGCDVWLNNPLRPLEACGTSGMKSALNGGLNLSIRDGWWDELYDGHNGWAIPTADGVENPERRDTLEANALYELIATHLVPEFYERGADGVPTSWVTMVRHTLATLRPQVQACRMVQEYVERLYAPAAGSAAAVCAGSFAGARELSRYRFRVGAAWPRVRVAQVDISGLPDTPELGSEMTVRATVVLAGLKPCDVDVQVVVGRVDDREELQDPLVVTMQPVGDSDGDSDRFEATLRLPHAGLVGYTVRVLPQHPLMAVPAEFGLLHLAT